MFGPVAAHLKAGDFAPEVNFTEVLIPGAATPWTSAALSGRLSVLGFFPDTSHNPQAIEQWNALVRQYRQKPVQFVWITSEYNPPLAPWLRDHPLEGWVLLDPLGATGAAYGMEVPAAVLIGSDRRILGFDPAMIPKAHTLDAALAGRIVTEAPQQPEDWKAFAGSGKVRLHAEPPRMPRPEDGRPDFAPSFEVHIAPARGKGAGESGGDDFWSFQNLDLKDILSILYETARVRIQLPPALDDGSHYDVAIVLPAAESRASIFRRIVTGMADHFRVTIAPEDRLADVYVVSAVDGKPPAAKARADDPDGFSADSSSVGFEVMMTGHSEGGAGPPEAVPLSSIRSIFVEGTTGAFCRALERQLDRPVVDETRLPGEFSFQLDAGHDPQNDFLKRLHDQLHLDVAAAERRVTVIAVKPR